MPKWVKFAGMWIVSALIAIGLSWVAVSQVRDRVVQPVRVVPSTVAAGEVDPVSPTTVVVEQTTVPDPSSATTVVRSTETTAAPASSTVTRGTTAASQPASSSTTSPPVASTPATSTTSTNATAPTPPTTTPSSKLSTHSVVGGTVTVRSSPGSVEFVSAIPKPGFTTELREVGPERVRVRFRDGEQSSEFEAEWENGQLRISSDE